MTIEPLPHVSFADFVAWEATQGRLHELVAGRVVPFLAGSADHELITGNVFATPAIAQLVFIESRERFVTSNVRDAVGMWLPPQISQGDGVLTFAPFSVSITLE